MEDIVTRETIVLLKTQAAIAAFQGGSGGGWHHHLVSQGSADEGALVMANEALERELVLLKHQAEESQQEAQKLALRLDTALLNLATKNQIITQMRMIAQGR
ncbi:hypothetical protein R1flu_019691 [Riccia fluitans]|uniref:Uncharacterized protein n=1 Tax=Riccia fluitans TaxID=41844 RepID=A0ABD1ZJE2_9MARC